MAFYNETYNNNNYSVNSVLKNIYFITKTKLLRRLTKEEIC